MVFPVKKSQKRINISVFFFLALIIFLSFKEVIIGTKVLFPHNLSHWYPWADYKGLMAEDRFGFYPLSDPIIYFYPKLQFVRESLSAGRLPLWNPWILSGSPNVSLIPYQLFYFIFPASITLAKSMSLSAVLHIFISGIFMYLFLKQLKAGTAASLLGGIAYMLNSYSLILASLPANLNAVCWLPVMLYLVDRIIEENRLVLAVPLALVLAVNFYESYQQFTVHAFYLIMVYTLVRLYFLKKGAGYNARVLGTAALALFFGALIYSPQAYLTYEVALHTDRFSKPFEYYASTKYPFPEALLTLFSFNMFGRPMTPDYWARSYSTGVLSGYLGPVIIFLTACSLFHENKKQVYLWLGVFAVAFAFSFSNTIFRLMVDYLPAFNISRPRGITLIIFSCIVLSAFGMDALIKRRNAGGLIYMEAGIILICLALATAAIYPGKFIGLLHYAGLAIDTHRFIAMMKSLTYSFSLSAIIMLSVLLYGKGFLRKNIFAASLVLFLLIDIFAVNLSFASSQEEGSLYYKTPEIEFMEKDRSLYRVMRFGPARITPPNICSVYKIQDTGGYDNLVLNYYKNIFKKIDGSSIAGEGRVVDTIQDAAALETPVVDMMNVKYLLTREELKSLKWELVFSGSVMVYKNRNFIERALFVNDWKVDKDGEKTLNAVTAPGFDPRRMAYIETAPPFGPEKSNTKASVTILEYKPNNVSIEIKSKTRGLLILSDVFYPTWKAYVDGAPVPVLKANYIYRAVALEKGKHRVDFVCRDETLYKFIALSLTVLTLVIFSILLYYVLNTIKTMRVRSRE